MIASYLEIFNAALTGQYPQLLQQNIIGQIFAIDGSDETIKFDLEQIISENVDKFLSMEDQDEVLVRFVFVNNIFQQCLSIFLFRHYSYIKIHFARDKIFKCTSYGSAVVVSQKVRILCVNIPIKMWAYTSIPPL